MANDKNGTPSEMHNRYLFHGYRVFSKFIQGKAGFYDQILIRALPFPLFLNFVYLHH